jgi:glyoxylase-like metal-dependent hydrolase (beta-lactamase superfamily II)
MSERLGRIADQASVRRLQLDDVRLTYVVDGAMAMAADRFFPSIPAAYWAEHPDELDQDQRVAMSAGALLVERDDHRLLIDAGLGSQAWDDVIGAVNCGELPNVLAALGLTPSDIDVLALTHVHIDHTGWAFHETSPDRREPVFPNAKYILAEDEWTPLARGEHSYGVPDTTAVIEPLRQMHPVLFQDGDEVAPGVQALVTPGHSAGHTSYVVSSSEGRRLVAFGDAFHVPAQLARPDWTSAPDVDPSAVVKARRRILTELSQPDTFGFAFHFGDQPFGQIMTDDVNPRRWQPVPTEALLPPPRIC